MESEPRSRGRQQAAPATEASGKAGARSWRRRLTEPLRAEDIRRLTVQMALIPVYIWIVFTWTGYARSVMTPGRLDDEGLVKGHDFVHFYVLGQVALEHRPQELYDYAAQARRTDQLAGYEDRYLPVYGPQVSMLFAPMARLPYGLAWAVWAGFSTIIYALSWYVLWRSEPVLRSYKWATLMAAVGYPPFAMLIGFGHISALALAAFALAYLAFRAERPWAAGLALGCLFIKPPLAVILPAVFLYARGWRVMAGAGAMVLLQLIAVWAYFGPAALEGYWHAATALGHIAADLEPQPHQMQSLRSFFSVLLPWPRAALACYLGAAAVVVIVAARHWRSAAPLASRYAVLLVAAVLVDPHVNVYDLVVLVPVFVLVSARAVREAWGWAGWGLLMGCFYAPIFSHWISAVFRVQFEVFLLVVLLGVIARFAPNSLHRG